MNNKKTKRKYNVVDQNVIDGAKFLSEKGMTNAVIARALKLSNATIYRFKASGWDLAKYKANAVEAFRRYRKVEQAGKGSQVIDTKSEEKTEVKALDTELLAKISSDLETLGKVATQTMDLLQQMLDFEHLKWEMRKEYIDKRNAEKEQSRPFFRR